jgi:hypothetical protein
MPLFPRSRTVGILANWMCLHTWFVHHVCMYAHNCKLVSLLVRFFLLFFFFFFSLFQLLRCTTSSCSLSFSPPPTLIQDVWWAYGWVSHKDVVGVESWTCPNMPAVLEGILVRQIGRPSIMASDARLNHYDLHRGLSGARA